MRTTVSPLSTAFAVLALLGSMSPAQALREGIHEPGQLQLQGRSMICGKVPTLVSNKYWMAAGSIKGLIGLNPHKLEPYDRVEQWMIYTHECGHQHVGTSEAEADCWAAGAGRREGWLKRSGLRRICSTLQNDPASDGYPSGRKRCQIMRDCYDRAVR